MNKRRILRIHRKRRIRAKVSGTENRPRLSVFRSHKGLYAQLIDDTKACTIAAHMVRGVNVANATTLGDTMAQTAKKNKITTIVFDRGGYQYHGVIKALADSLRSGGLQF